MSEVLRNLITQAMITPYDRAKTRVEDSAVLRPHADSILADWPEGDEHWQWVCTAPESEIVDWVEAGHAGTDDED